MGPDASTSNLGNDPIWGTVFDENIIFVSDCL